MWFMDYPTWLKDIMDNLCNLNTNIDGHKFVKDDIILYSTLRNVDVSHIGICINSKQYIHCSLPNGVEVAKIRNIKNIIKYVGRIKVGL